LQADDEARPLGRGDGDGPISLRNITHGGLGAWGEASNEEGDCGESAPGAWEICAIDVGVDGCCLGQGVVQVREIVYCLIFAWLGCLGDQGQGGGLERAQIGLQLLASEWADVSAGCKFAIHNLVIYSVEVLNGVMVMGGIGVVDPWNTKVKTICEASDKGGVSGEQAEACKL